jgi:malonate transporter
VTTTLSILAPIFGLLAIGFAAARLRLIGPEAVAGLVKVVSVIEIPALLFRALARERGDVFAGIDVAAVYFAACLVLLVAAYMTARLALRLDGAESGVFGMGAVYSNSSLIGVPVAGALLGERGLTLLTKIIALHSLVLIPLSTLIVAFGAQAGRDRLRPVLAAVLGSPMVLGLLAGLLWRETGLAIPPALDRLTALLSDAASPTALIALGATIARTPWPRAIGTPLLAAGLKLVAHPLLVWALARQSGLSNNAVLIMTATAALPPGINVYVMANHFNRYAEDAARSFALATVLSMVTVVVVITALSGNPGP